MKHTEGTWEAKWSSSTYVQIENEKGVLIAIIDPYKKTGQLQINFEEYNANANLIAAAPELLEALKQVQEWESFGNHIDENVMLIVNNVIKKAES